MFSSVVNRQYDHRIDRSSSLFQLTKGNEWLLQRMSLLKRLDVHRGCVNSVIWDDPGNYILSGSDDQHLVISNPWKSEQSQPLSRIHTCHRANIFSAKFLPFSSNRKIVSCSGDGVIVFTDVEREEETYDCKFTCHQTTCYDLVTLPDDAHTFLSCGEDGTIRWFDVRTKDRCAARNCKADILVNMGSAVTAVAVNPVTPFHMAVGTQDSTVRIYDRRCLGTRAQDSFLENHEQALMTTLRPPALDDKRNHRITCLRYDMLGTHILASYSSDYMYLFDLLNAVDIPLLTSGNGCVGEGEKEGGNEPSMKRLRLRGDWSDTGPQALPESEMRAQAGEVGQARPTLHATLMQRMTDVLSRMLNETGEPRRVDLGEIVEGESDGEGEEGNASVPIAAEPEADVPLPEADVSLPEADVSLPEAEVPLCEDEVPLPGPSSNSDLGHVELNLIPPLTILKEQYEKLNEVETAVDLNYSAQGVNSGLISLGVADETMRQSGSRLDFVDQLNESVDLTESEASNLKESNSPNPNESEPGNPPKIVSVKFMTDDATNQNECIATNFSEACVGNLPELVETNEDTTPSHSENVNPKLITISQSATSLTGSVRLETVDQSSQEEGLGQSSQEEHQGASSSYLLTQTERGSVVDPDDEDISEHDSDDERPTFSTRSASERVASAIDRAVQKGRQDRAPGVHWRSDRKVPRAAVRQVYKGHRNARTMIKEACFWGDSHVMSGSDCGRVFVWSRDTGRLAMLWEADRHVVNCLQPHPTLPVLATAGIDYDVKVWAPVGEEPLFDGQQAEQIAQRNETLLEETRDTITVPATFMIRMLASLNHIRRGGRWRQRNRGRGGDNEPSDA